MKTSWKTRCLAAQRRSRELERLFEMQHKRTRHADILWREHFGKPDTSPDLGALVDWLIDRGNRWQAVLAAARNLMNGDGAVKHAIALSRALSRYDEFYGSHERK